MIRFKHIFLAVGLLAVAASPMAADQQAAPEAAKTLKAQTRCPVMGGKIDSTVYTDIQGQRVYHCCPGCSEKLVADPDTYFKKTAALGILFENTQTTCPVSGDSLKNRDIYTDYDGRRLYFSSEENRAAFVQKPQEFLKKMAVSVKPEKPVKPSSEGHSGHGGH